MHCNSAFLKWHLVSGQKNFCGFSVTFLSSQVRINVKVARSLITTAHNEHLTSTTKSRDLDPAPLSAMQTYSPPSWRVTESMLNTSPTPTLRSLCTSKYKQFTSGYCFWARQNCNHRPQGQSVEHIIPTIQQSRTWWSSVRDGGGGGAPVYTFFPFYVVMPNLVAPCQTVFNQRLVKIL